MSGQEKLAIGIDIGGTGTKYGIVDRDGNVLFSGEMSTRKHKEPISVLERKRGRAARRTTAYAR